MKLALYAIALIALTIGCSTDRTTEPIPLPPEEPSTAFVAFAGKLVIVYGEQPHISRSVTNTGGDLARDVLWSVLWQGQRRTFWWQTLSPGDTARVTLIFNGPMVEGAGAPVGVLSWAR